ncbi:glutamine amidotransferase [Candidatus Rariloculus sp.]|uniref:glutamine amidotransferase n=1 Tax=Candidatus Rariloculus sp. TaxID=3101265 RepID=UPI003D100087
MKRPILVIQLRPEDAAANSEFGAILRYGGLREDEVVRARVERTGLPGIELGDYASIIVGGSPFDVSTPDNAKSAIQKRIESDFMALFERIVAVDFPFLGACSGNGLLGKYCGAHISTKYAEPVGGADIKLTEEGKRDPLLEGFPGSFRVLLGHKEACDDIPPGAVLLAFSAACPVQMFRLRNNIYATQFHPEGDPDGFVVRINAYRRHGYFPPETADKLVAAVANEDTPVPQRILARFVRRYHGEPVSRSAHRGNRRARLDDPSDRSGMNSYSRRS